MRAKQVICLHPSAGVGGQRRPPQYPVRMREYTERPDVMAQGHSEIQWAFEARSLLGAQSLCRGMSHRRFWLCPLSSWFHPLSQPSFAEIYSLCWLTSHCHSLAPAHGSLEFKGLFSLCAVGPCQSKLIQVFRNFVGFLMHQDIIDFGRWEPHPRLFKVLVLCLGFPGECRGKSLSGSASEVPTRAWFAGPHSTAPPQLFLGSQQSSY